MLDINFSPFPELTTTRFHLRQISSDHAEEMYSLRSDPESMKFIGRKPAASVQDAIDLINRMNGLWEKNEGITWGIISKDTEKLVGTTGFHRIEKENFRAEIGYMLKSEAFGKQIMTEIMPLMIDFAFNFMQAHTIEARVNPGNSASIRLLRKFDFKQEAHLTENFFFEGVFSDTLIFSLLNRNHEVPAV